MVATYRSSDTSPKERFVHHQAGDGGFGGSSYIDLMAFREKDANTAWTSASDGTLEERLYYCQNQHADVVALITAAGTQREMVRYSAYGVPFGLPVGDCDSDGDCEIGERNLVQAWITGSAYDVRGDIDLDGDVDSTDKDAVRDYWEGVTLGRGVLSAGAVANRRGVAGYHLISQVMESLYNVRSRGLDTALGTWMGRDAMGYIDGENLIQYARSSPANNRDASGTSACTAEAPYNSPARLDNEAPTAGTPSGAGLQWRIVFAEPADGHLGDAVTCLQSGSLGSDCASSHCTWGGCSGSVAFQFFNQSTGEWERPRRDGRPPGCLAWEYWHNTPCTEPPKDGSKWPEWSGDGATQGKSEHKLKPFDVGPIDCRTGLIKTWCAKSPQVGTPNHPGLTTFPAGGSRTEQTEVCVSVLFNCSCASD